MDTFVKLCTPSRNLREAARFGLSHTHTRSHLCIFVCMIMHYRCKHVLLLSLSHTQSQLYLRESRAHHFYLCYPRLPFQLLPALDQKLPSKTPDNYEYIIMALAH